MKVVQRPMVKVALILSNNNTLLLLALTSPQSAATERNITIVKSTSLKTINITCSVFEVQYGDSPACFVAVCGFRFALTLL